MNFERSDCPVAVTLDIFGDKWTLLVVRDMFLGARRFNDFLESPEQIRTNILAERLKRLEAYEIIERSLYQEKPPRYEYSLTKRGLALRPFIKEVTRWANTQFPKTMTPAQAMQQSKWKN